MRVKSLCPTLGEPYAELFNGICPKLLQSPYGKNFSVTFIGTGPYIDDDDFETDHDSCDFDAYVGSEFLVMKILAEKFKFFPNFIPETESFDGMVNSVKYTYTHIKGIKAWNRLMNIPLQVSQKQSEMGIGQAQILHYRTEFVEYLPYMYLYEFIWGDKNPEQITSYETIIRPFDNSVWAFTIGFTLFALITLVIMQKIYSYASGQEDPCDYVYQGNLV